MEYISPTPTPTPDYNTSKSKINYNLKDTCMLDVLEDILECSIDKKGFYLNNFPLNSNIGNVYDSKKSDYIFYIDRNKDEKFGISCDKHSDDYLHIDPDNWKFLSLEKKELFIDVFLNKKKQKMKFKETSSIEELERINNLFSKEYANH